VPSDRVGLDAADEVAHHVGPVDEKRPQHVRARERVGKVDGGARRERTDQEFDQARRALVGPQQVPAAVDDQGRKRFLLPQHEVEGGADRSECGRAEIVLLPARCKPGRHQEAVVLAQRQIERRRQAVHHGAARRGASELEKAQMTLRDSGPAGQLELRPGAALAPLP
jgi:hypothetical protein